MLSQEILIPLLIVYGVMFGLLNLAGALIWVERRALALWQDRLGPNRLGPLGIFQLVADIIKIFTKEDWIPPFADRVVFVIAPTIVFIAVLLIAALIPFGENVVVFDPNIGVLCFLAFSSMGIYSVVLGGWSSANKFSLLGGIRASSQMFSYEVFMGLSLMGVVILSESFSLVDIVAAQQGMWFIIPQFFGFLPFLFAGMAESHRMPFDGPEAESEIIAGFHSEYSGMKFGMFFVGEYVGVAVISALVVTFFFGGWLGPDFLPGTVWFFLKTFVFILFFILARASIPRPRYDQLFAFGWKVILPITLLNLIITGAVVLALEG